MKNENVTIVEPQIGKQTDFLCASADIVFYGGSAGGGKTFALIMESVRYMSVDNFHAIIVRKLLEDFKMVGGIWSEASHIYTKLGGVCSDHNVKAKFNNGKSTISGGFIKNDADCMRWLGVQAGCLLFDELTNFTKYQFFDVQSRLRSMSGVKPYVRATLNPDADSWIREFIDWWIDGEGYAIESRCGVVRYFVHINDVIYWFCDKKSALDAYPDSSPKSFTFINASVSDNEKMLDVNPDYVSNLKSLSRVRRERLLNGNWNVRVAGGDYFDKADFECVDSTPRMVTIFRCWDLAGTKPSESNPDPDWTVGVKVGIDKEGMFYVLDVVRIRHNFSEVKKLIKNTASQDGINVNIRLPSDAGSSGKGIAQVLISMLAGYKVKSHRPTGSKENRALPASGQVSGNNVKVLRGDWNREFFAELEGFPKVKHDDMVDAFSDCISFLSNKKRGIRGSQITF